MVTILAILGLAAVVGIFLVVTSGPTIQGRGF